MATFPRARPPRLSTVRVVATFAALFGLLGVMVTSAASAQQITIVDETYTATADNTSDSHYYVLPNGPHSWVSPVNYAGGRVHARLEVLSKPSDQGTLYNICFEGTPSYACMPYSPLYTTTGVYDFEYPFSAFYQNDMVDWTEGTERVALILKDEGEIKKQGDPAFYPTQIHVTLTLVAEGATYEPPDENPVMDAGDMEDAAMPDDGDAMDAASMEPPPVQPPMMPRDSGVPMQPVSGMSAPAVMTPDASAPDAASTTSMMATIARMPWREPDLGRGGCAVQPGRTHSTPASYALYALALVIASLRRRRTFPNN